MSLRIVAGRPLALLRAHVGERADDSRGGRRREIAEVRDAEVGEARDAGVVEEHVPRLHVAVQDAEPVRLSQRGEHGARDLHGPRRCQRALQHVLQVPSAHPREHDGRALLDEVAERHDVRVIERAEHLHLALEARQRVAPGAARVVAAEDLHRDALASHRVRCTRGRARSPWTPPRAAPRSARRRAAALRRAVRARAGCRRRPPSFSSSSRASAAACARPRRSSATPDAP